MLRIEGEVLGENFEISDGVLGVSRDTFLNLIEHMKYKEKTMLKNV
jgi:hypothetical protein